MKQKFAAYDAQRLVSGFYDSIDSPVPDGVPNVPITDEQYAFLLAGYAAGKRMALDENNAPVLLDALPPTREQVATQKRVARDAAMTATDWLIARHQDEKLIGDGTTLTPDQFAVLLRYRRALRELSDAPGWPIVDLPAVPDFLT
ncbi:phage tail protein [Paraburkholderia aspalathi]|uniref:phage tail protein n=1 Tax=Paraburkholderia aspalathi TaxID=1324617 RepID=UPI003CC14D86